MTFEEIAQVLQIILIDIVLSGDNAVVIALAAHKLPAYQRRRAILWGGGIAIILRIVFTMIMAFLMMVPGLRLIGGAVLVWIACKLLLEEEEHEVTPDDADRSALAAIRMIFIADFMMSLDNMLAVAGASHGDPKKLLMGLLVSIAIIMTCSGFIARLMNRFKIIVVIGAGILAFTAGEMMFGDREVAGYIVRNHQVSLNSHWEHDYMLTHDHVSSFDADGLPPDLARLVQFKSGKLTFVGRMNESQRDELKSRVGTDKDRHAVDEMYEESYERPVPDWVPDSLNSSAKEWVQRKWPAEMWESVQGHRYHSVARIFYAVCVIFCVTCPRWMRRRKSAEEQPHA
jgi:YjbE family integral membrane protein